MLSTEPFVLYQNEIFFIHLVMEGIVVPMTLYIFKVSETGRMNEVILKLKWTLQREPKYQGVLKLGDGLDLQSRTQNCFNNSINPLSWAGTFILTVPPKGRMAKLTSVRLELRMLRTGRNIIKAFCRTH